MIVNKDTYYQKMTNMQSCKREKQKQHKVLPNISTGCQGKA